MTFSVGQRLRQARLDQGLDLESVVARTKISLRYLKAIEADDRASFPSGFFYKSFVDQYARALAVDTLEIDAEINRILSAEAPLPLPGQLGEVVKQVPPMVLTPRAEKAGLLASLAIFVVALVGCTAFYVWWHRTETAAPPPAVVATAQQPAPIPAGKPAPPHETPPHPEAASAVPVALTSPQPAAVPPIDAPPPDAAQQEPGYKVLLDLIAREETWLSVSSDGRMIFKGTLEPNETRTFEGREFAKLRVRNAAALEVKLNGRRLGPLGEPGQFRVVLFTQDKFHFLEPDKESD